MGSRFTGGKNLPVIFIFYRLSHPQINLLVKIFEFCPAAGKFNGILSVIAGICWFLPVILPVFRRWIFTGQAIFQSALPVIVVACSLLTGKFTVVYR